MPLREGPLHALGPVVREGLIAETARVDRSSLALASDLCVAPAVTWLGPSSAPALLDL